MAWSSASGGSDWLEWRVRDVATGQDLPDLIKWSKFSGAAWMKDGSGFFYSRYAAPKDGDALKGVNKNQKVYFHRSARRRTRTRSSTRGPTSRTGASARDVTDDGRFLLVYQREGTDPRNRIFVQDLHEPGAAIEPFLDAFDAEYDVVGNDGDVFYVRTDKDARRNRVVAIDRRHPEPSAWKEIVPQDAGKGVLSSVGLIGDRLVVVWQVDAHDVLQVYAQGRLARARGRAARASATSTALGPPPRRGGLLRLHVVHLPDHGLPLRPGDRREHACSASRRCRSTRPRYETAQVFYPSKDGTKIPMFITRAARASRATARARRCSPATAASTSRSTPSFSPGVIAWLEMGGVYALANLRGGGEYGKEWHDAGRLQNKQNVFDDFIAAAEYLVREKYTSTREARDRRRQQRRAARRRGAQPAAGPVRARRCRRSA